MRCARAATAWPEPSGRVCGQPAGAGDGAAAGGESEEASVHRGGVCALLHCGAAPLAFPVDGREMGLEWELGVRLGAFQPEGGGMAQKKPQYRNAYE
ncbi:MAG: hypothetical protein ACUVSB_12865 [Anaerolineae bacterium]